MHRNAGASSTQSIFRDGACGCDSGHGSSGWLQMLLHKFTSEANRQGEANRFNQLSCRNPLLSYKLDMENNHHVFHGKNHSDLPFSIANCRKLPEGSSHKSMIHALLLRRLTMAASVLTAVLSDWGWIAYLPGRLAESW